MAQIDYNKLLVSQLRAGALLFPVAFVVGDWLRTLVPSLYPATGLPPGDAVIIIVGTVAWRHLSLRKWSTALTIATIVAWVGAAVDFWATYRGSRGLPI